MATRRSWTEDSIRNEIAPIVAELGRMPTRRELTDRGLGAEFLVHMPGPWDAPVRVVERTATSFRFATLRGHIEAGEIEFRAALPRTETGKLQRFRLRQSQHT